MRLSYKNNKLEKSLTKDKELARRYGTLAKKIKQRINQLKSAENLEIISELPVLRLHPYIGKDRGIWSIDIQENWRILFKISQDPLPTLDNGDVDFESITIICIERIEDPH